MTDHTASLGHHHPHSLKNTTGQPSHHHHHIIINASTRVYHHHQLQGPGRTNDERGFEPTSKKLEGYNITDRGNSGGSTRCSTMVFRCTMLITLLTNWLMKLYFVYSGIIIKNYHELYLYTIKYCLRPYRTVKTQKK